MSDTVLMPKELTAENGAKALLIGEFKEQITLPCPECADTGLEDDCHICQGAGEYQQGVIVSWTTIKAIYRMAVEHIGIEDGSHRGVRVYIETGEPAQNSSCEHKED